MVNIHMSKADSQLRLVARLRDYCNYNERIASHYTGQADFTREHLALMIEPIMDLKKQTLSEACEKFLKDFKEGKVTEEAKAEFLDLLLKFIPYGDFVDVKVDLALGDKQALEKTFKNLRLASLIEEERKKPEDRDKSAEKLISFYYNRLEFGKFEEEYIRNPSMESLDAILIKTRKSVAEYCCVLRIPKDNDDTLSPFLLSRIEAMIAANERLLNKLRYIQETFNS